MAKKPFESSYDSITGEVYAVKCAHLDSSGYPSAGNTPCGFSDAESEVKSYQKHGYPNAFACPNPARFRSVIPPILNPAPCAKPGKPPKPPKPVKPPKPTPQPMATRYPQCALLTGAAHRECVATAKANGGSVPTGAIPKNYSNNDIAKLVLDEALQLSQFQQANTSQNELISTQLAKPAQSAATTTSGFEFGLNLDTLLIIAGLFGIYWYYKHN